MKILERYWRSAFEWSLLLKGFNGVWESIAGFLVLVVSRDQFLNFFQYLARGELLEDPRDKLLNFLAQALSSISNDTKVFAAIYILFHGLLNIYLAIELHKNRLWAYLVAMGSMFFILLYQIYRFYLYRSLLLLGITVFDLLFILLTWHEYRIVKNGRASISIQ